MRVLVISLIPVGLYVAYIRVDMIYGCLIYQDLRNGMWEVP